MIWYDYSMKATEVIRYFSETYPGKNIVCLPEDDPNEIICEVDPSVEHPEYNKAIAAIHKSEPHYHKEAVETYHVLRGELHLFVNEVEHILKPGDVFVVHPNEVHYAVGDFTLVEVDSEPGWTPDDHYLM